VKNFDKEGMLIDPAVTLKRFPGIEHGQLNIVHAIVLHQTDSSSSKQTFSSYLKRGNGAHFLIDNDGTVFQTASVKKALLPCRSFDQIKMPEPEQKCLWKS